ncbi:MAG: 2'-5' RNA ligase family protein [Frankiaceae bacterium]|nr:2'-5' RNA ligase family protein [Frankiaceae bacterium]
MSAVVVGDGAVGGGAGEDAEGVDSVVLGVAIPVPSPHSGILVDERRRSGDPEALLVPPHITLLPPIRVPQAELSRIEQHLAGAAAAVAPFAVHLSGTGTFRPVSQVVFVQVAAGLSGCEQLESRVRCGPLARELTFPYHPHVTIAQDVAPAALDRAYESLQDFVARFRVSAFTMFQRGKDGAWVPKREFPLGAGRAGAGAGGQLG